MVMASKELAKLTPKNTKKTPHVNLNETVSSDKAVKELGLKKKSKEKQVLMGPFTCHLHTKKNKIASYQLQLTPQEVQIISESSGRVKTTIQLDNVMLKDLAKQERALSKIEDEDLSTEITPTNALQEGGQAQADNSQPEKAIKKQLYYYPAKFVLPPNRSRVVFFEDRQTRKAVFRTILSILGFESRLDQYEILEQVDEPSSNPVFQAVHRITGLKVAIKAIETQKYRNLNRKNHISEGDAMQLCQEGKQILTLVDEFRYENETYIVTKFCEGGDLMAYLEAHKLQRLPEERVLSIFHQIAMGLRVIHENGLIHRDLKHMNILLSSLGTKPKVKIADFGLAYKFESVDEKLQCDQLLGTVGFMSPQVAAKQPFSQKADVWSIGVILFALLTSHVPFEGSSNEETLEKIINDELVFDEEEWQGISEECMDLVCMLLAKDEAERPTVHQVMAHQWLSQHTI